jgi:hypothetical protein
MRDMGPTLATEADNPRLKLELHLLRKEMELFSTSMTWRFAVIQAVAAVFLYASLKLT